MTRNASKAANALKTIGQRIRGVGEDAEEGLQASLQKMFDQYGINIQIMNEQTGEMASTFDILKAISDQWDNLTEAQRQNVGETAAGKNRITEFNALMLNFDQTLKATEAAYDSAGITAKQFAVYQDSVEGKLEGLKLQWQSLVAEGGVINNFIKLILDAGTAVLKFANSDIVKFIVKTAAFTAGLYVATKAVGALGVALWSLALNNPVGLFLGLTTGVAALALQLEKTHDPIYKAEQDINNLKIRIQETNDTISQLEAAGADDSILAMYRAQAADLNKELEEAEQRLFHVKNADFKVASGATEPEDMGAGIGGYKINWESTNRVDQAISKYNEAAEAVQKYEHAVILGEDAEEDYLNALNSQAEARQSLIDIYAEFKEQEDSLTDSEEDQYEAIKNQLEVLGYLGEGYENIAELVKAYGANAANVIDNQLATSMNTLNNVIDEQNRKGQISAELYNSLIKLFPELANQATQVGNGYKFADGALQQYINDHYKEIDAMKAAKQAAVDFINANGAKQVSINNTSKSLHQEIDAMIKETEVERARVSATLEAEAKIAGAKAATASGYAKGSEAYARTIGKYVTSAKLADSSYTNLTKSLSEMYGIRNALNIVEYKNTSITNSNTVSKNSSASATNKQTDATKKQTEATNKQTEATKKQTEATKKQTEAEQKLKEEVSNTTNALKEQSNILGQAADLMISRLNDEISALEAQKRSIQDANDALEDQIELEEALDALAKAKSRKVLTYSGGQFVYSADASAVGEAQKRVDEIRRQQAQQAQIDAIDKRIDAIKAEQDTWRNVKNAYDEYLGAQQLGVSVEGDAWKKRIGQATEYANQYLKIMQTLAGVESGAISLSSGKTMLASAKTFGKNLKASTAYKTLLETPIQTSNLKAQATGAAQQTVYQYFGDISLPNVTNAEQFVNDLKNFQQFASQSATSR